MSFVLRLALDTLVLPVLPVAIVVAVAFATQSAAARRSLGAVAVASGIVIAHLVNVGVPRLPPLDTIGWIPFATVATLLGLLLERQPAGRLALTFVITAITARLLGRPVWPSPIEAAPWALFAGAISAAMVGALEIAVRRMAPSATMVAFAVTMAGGSIACLFGHSALLAQVLGASAAVIGASGLVAIYVEPAKTIASVAAVSAVSVIVYAGLYATLSPLVVALLVAAATAPIGVSALPLQPRVRAIVTVVTASALSAAAALCARA